MSMSFYEDMVQGLNEAIEYKKGNVKLRTSDVTIAPLPEIKSEDIKIKNKSVYEVINKYIRAKDNVENNNEFFDEKVMNL